VKKSPKPPTVIPIIRTRHKSEIIVRMHPTVQTVPRSFRVPSLTVPAKRQNVQM